ncbi:hypothetical protein NG798_00465 [Ancylothrix sp. C2]|uniref:hypothetical protein n=1 Tax=Ancylothrix sp. D3o TaxID=2953691 RepID=UPI0021BAF588|nr:hypothetical protein [Ancylothrix sp. D3o]MCT7948265.1 hypothetical protein [Ancylothrix sp. D3o]
MALNNSKFAPEFRKPGDLILYEDWNAAMQEIVRLESHKVNRQGGDFLQGPLTIEAALAVDTTSTTSLELEVKGALKLADGVAVNQFSNDGSLSENSDSIVPTQKAIRTYVDTAQKAVETYVETVAKGVVLKGMILMWSGKGEEIPTGWVLCDGNNGTPNLTDKFIVGAGNGYAVGATGGADSVTLTIAEMPTHSHGVNDPGHNHSRGAIWPGSGTEQEQAGKPENRTTFNIETGNSQTGISIENTGGNQPHENRPPYYALAFIMKL